MATQKKECYRTSIVFSLKDKVGALLSALKSFKKYRINLTRIVSRPDINKEWEYIFFIEIERKKDSPNVKKALSELKSNTCSIYVLGTYPLKIV